MHVIDPLTIEAYSFQSLILRLWGRNAEVQFGIALCSRALPIGRPVA